VIAATLAAVCVFAYFTVKWGIASSIASRAEDREVAAFAAELSPNDPQTRFANALLLSKTFVPADAERSLEELKTAAALTPNNYLAWIELGRGLERSGDQERAVAAFRRARELAPNYSMVKWSLGNALLRDGDQSEALELIAAAGEADPRYTEAAAGTVLLAAGGDLESALSTLSDRPMTRGRLMTVLIREKRTADALRIWNTLKPEQKKGSFADAGAALYAALIGEGSYRSALSVIASISDDKLASHAAGTLIDGGFEDLSLPKYRTVFEWRIADGTVPRIGATEGQKMNGAYSLMINFPPGTSAFRSVSQAAAVEPGITYSFHINVKASLSGSGVLKWEIVDLKDGKRLAVSDVLNSAAEWSPVSFQFAVPAGSDGIEVRLIKECTAACTLEGNIWFDDASIKAVATQ
jgi:hypothetical protein